MAWGLIFEEFLKEEGGEGVGCFFGSGAASDDTEFGAVVAFEGEEAHDTFCIHGDIPFSDIDFLGGEGGGGFDEEGGGAGMDSVTVEDGDVSD